MRIYQRSKFTPNGRIMRPCRAWDFAEIARLSTLTQSHVGLLTGTIAALERRVPSTRMCGARRNVEAPRVAHDSLADSDVEVVA